MTSAERAELLRRWALEAGFDRAGVARLEPSQQGPAYLEWLARGDHAGMAWMTRRVEERLEPERLLPGARSALVVALQYAPLVGEGEPEGDLWPRVARYARGRDYHDLMNERLGHLRDRLLEAFPGTGVRRAVDTSPILERELAARAGLGVQGKNTLLLSRAGGSYFLLGELLLTLDLAPDPPIADLCGRCTQCLDHCPTGALTAPYRLDSRRCISYWTIEHRGDIPEDVRPELGEWVFGCDICQEVCPWNRRGPEPGDHPELHLPAERAELDLIGLLTLSREAYTERFRGTAMKRAKLEGLKRNAAIAMGNRGDECYREALVAATTDESPGVAEPARWALERLGRTRA